MYTKLSDNFYLKKLFKSPILFLSFLLTTFLSTGCEDDTGGPEISTGKIIGLVRPVDQWEREIENKSGIRVQLKGTNVADTTGKSGNYGRYVLKDVEAGTYTITLTKDGYGTMKIPFYDYFGNGREFVEDGLSTSLGKIPQYDIRLDTIFIRDTFSGKRISVEGALSEAAPSKENGVATVVTYVSKSSDISPKNASTYLNVSTSVSFPTVTRFGSGFDLSQFEPGTKLYFQSYPTASSILFYLDPTAKTNNFVYCCLGTPSEVKSLVVPEAGPSSIRADSKRNRVSITLNGKSGTTIEYFKNPKDKTPLDIAILRKQLSNLISVKQKN